MLGRSSEAAGPDPLWRHQIAAVILQARVFAPTCWLVTENCPPSQLQPTSVKSFATANNQLQLGQDWLSDAPTQLA